jgi:transglutaminase-like putative cysteine protease
MKLRIAYRTEYAYGTQVSFSPHRFRLFPRTEFGVQIASQRFDTNAGAVTSYRRDVFDNPIASTFYPEQGEQLLVALDLELFIERRNAFNFLLDSAALNFPFVYPAEDSAALAPFLDNGTEAVDLALPFWQLPPEGTPTMETLLNLNRAIHQNIAYSARAEGEARPPEETIRLASGSCRDYAVLLAAILRRHGVASRLVSGFLLESEEAARQVAQNAMHAWVEAYLPGAGWIGFDPTNGYLCDHHHIATAVGVNPTQITPILGTYYSEPGEQVTPTMTATLKITLDEEE